jgi:protein disulfide-isomerase A1
MVNKYLVLLICVACVFAAEPEVEDHVLVLTDENFDATIKQYPNILVEFYAPWCGHCKKLAPEYSGAAEVLKAEGVPLAKVDCTVQKETAEKFKIQGFPTLKFFSNGVDSEYQGGRTKSDIVAWMRKKTGPASKELKTVSEVEDFFKGEEAIVLLVGQEGFENYGNYAKSIEDVNFVHCFAQECLSNYNVSSGTVVVLKKFDDKRNDLAPGYSFDSFKSFLETKTKPMIMSFNEKCAQHIFGKSVPGLFLYYDKTSSNAEALLSILREVAPLVKDKIQVIATGITEGLEQRLAEYVGVKDSDLPSVRIADTRSELKKYNMSGEISTDNILNFVKDWEAGRLKVTLKSEPVPTSQPDAVFTLVGTTFESVVFDQSKDVLVEFYAPWCGHCKKIAPIYEEVAQKLKHNTNLVIAKMDSTANETEHVSIQGFPTIKFWPAGNKSKALDFEGDRTVEGFIEFLTKHSTNALEPKTDL